MTWYKLAWKKVVLQLLFPLHCPVCDKIVVPFGEKICFSCIKKLKVITSPWCLKCGKQLKNQEKEYCMDCTRHRREFLQGRSLYQYHSVAPGIYRMKYGNRQEYADFYGEEIIYYLGNFIRYIQPDALIPIPLHSSRQRKRGYNQAELLADAISKYSNIPVYNKILIRRKKTVPLKYLNPQERQNNLKKAFHMVENDVKLKVIILVDDIYTTGSTIEEAASVLKEGGVEKVYFITLANGTE